MSAVGEEVGAFLGREAVGEIAEGRLQFLDGRPAALPSRAPRMENALSIGMKSGLGAEVEMVFAGRLDRNSDGRAIDRTYRYRPVETRYNRAPGLTPIRISVSSCLGRAGQKPLQKRRL